MTSFGKILSVSALALVGAAFVPAQASAGGCGGGYVGGCGGGVVVYSAPLVVTTPVVYYAAPVVYTTPSFVLPRSSFCPIYY